MCLNYCDFLYEINFEFPYLPYKLKSGNYPIKLVEVSVSWLEHLTS